MPMVQLTEHNFLKKYFDYSSFSDFLKKVYTPER